MYQLTKTTNHKFSIPPSGRSPRAWDAETKSTTRWTLNKRPAKLNQTKNTLKNGDHMNTHSINTNQFTPQTPINFNRTNMRHINAVISNLLPRIYLKSLNFNVKSTHNMNYTTEQKSILRLIRTDQIGAVTFHKLMRKYGSAENALDNWFQEAVAHKVSLASLQAIETEIVESHTQGYRLVFYTDPDYPPLLRNAVSPPPVLTVKGDLSLCQRTCVAIVGARNASYQGKSLAHKIAQDLGEKDVTIISGLARGIDTAAHRGSLKTGTVGVLAGGIDIVYPEENKDLYDAMGLVLTDMPLGMVPQAAHFPKRNRLIAALCQAVVVIEAAYQSGSLLTAKFATDEGREVFAVPGSPLDPRCRGSNLLLKKGASLVESAADVLDLLYPQLATHVPVRESVKNSAVAEPSQIDNTVQDQILMALSHTPTAGDQILQSCAVPARTFWSTIADLEMQGKIIRSTGNYLALRV